MNYTSLLFWKRTHKIQFHKKKIFFWAYSLWLDFSSDVRFVFKKTHSTTLMNVLFVFFRLYAWSRHEKLIPEDIKAISNFHNSHEDISLNALMRYRIIVVTLITAGKKIDLTEIILRK